MDDIMANTNHLSGAENDLPIVYIISFGVLNGPLSPHPDLSIDLRSLPNPPKHIRNGQTGLSKPLRDWLFVDALAQQRFQQTCRLIREYLDVARMDGLRRVVVGVNCQIGRHRSVAVVEELGRVRFEGWNVVIRHRDVHRKRASRKHQVYHEREP